MIRTSSRIGIIREARGAEGLDVHVMQERAGLDSGEELQDRI